KLDTLCRKYGYLWWEKNGCIYLRARAWPWDMSYEVPDRFLDAWTAALEQHREIGEAEIDALAALSPIQLNGLTTLGSSRFGGSTGPDRPEVREFLSFFRQTNPGTRALLLGPGCPLEPQQIAAFPSWAG